MKLRGCLLVFALLALLAGCESTPTHTFTYAAQGTVIQAERFVGQFLGKDVWPLPYRGGNIEPPLQRMQARFPQLKALLDSGELGLTDDGEVVIRDPGTSTPELFALVRDENGDRTVFYVGLSFAVGHGSSLPSWLPYVKSTFGAEWQKQALAGWYLRDQNGQWRRQP